MQRENRATAAFRWLVHLEGRRLVRGPLLIAQERIAQGRGRRGFHSFDCFDSFDGGFAWRGHLHGLQFAQFAEFARSFRWLRWLRWLLGRQLRQFFGLKRPTQLRVITGENGSRAGEP